MQDFKCSFNCLKYGPQMLEPTKTYFLFILGLAVDVQCAARVCCPFLICFMYPEQFNGLDNHTKGVG